MNFLVELTHRWFSIITLVDLLLQCLVLVLILDFWIQWFVCGKLSQAKYGCFIAKKFASKLVNLRTPYKFTLYFKACSFSTSLKTTHPLNGEKKLTLNDKSCCRRLSEVLENPSVQCNCGLQTNWAW